ncbi:hypothetical protein VUR80DRAFT_7992 [Thermomyces stellatus]
MSVPATFNAALLNNVGERLVVGSRSLPPLDPGEVAIKVTATAVNPVDWKIRDSGWFISTWPTVVGSDAAGEIAALAPDVSGFAVGDRVFFQGKLGHEDSCTFQQYCKMPADLLSKTPRGISDEQAAGIALTTVAVLTGFYDTSGRGMPAPWDKGGDKAGQGKAIVILGGATSVGQHAIQFARLSGYERIVTTASPNHREYLTGMGAHEVLDRHTVKPADFREALGGLPLDLVFDSPSLKETQAQGVEVVRAVEARDSLVVTLMPVNDEVEKLGETGDFKVPVRFVLGIGSDPKLEYLSKPLAKHLGGEDGWVAKGLVRPNRVRVVDGGLGSLDGALEKLKAGVSGEKLVVRPHE